MLLVHFNSIQTPLASPHSSSSSAAVTASASFHPPFNDLRKSLQHRNTAVVYQKKLEWSIDAGKGESEADYEANRSNKARQALKELDLQLESLSKKQVTRQKIRSSSFSKGWWSVDAGEEEPQVDDDVKRDKARQALEELDEQLHTLSKKQVSSPKIRATDFNYNSLKEQFIREAAPEISGSALASTAFVLVALTLFYNIVFLSVIKPSIDTPEQAAVSATDSTSSYTYEEFVL